MKIQLICCKLSLTNMTAIKAFAWYSFTQHAFHMGTLRDFLCRSIESAHDSIRISSVSRLYEWLGLVWLGWAMACDARPPATPNPLNGSGINDKASNILVLRAVQNEQTSKNPFSLCVKHFASLLMTKTNTFDSQDLCIKHRHVGSLRQKRHGGEGNR